jgi:hypothetical protein
MQWLQVNGFLGNGQVVSSAPLAYFEVTRSDKLNRIGELGCDCFIDDLPELLSAPDFPRGVRRVLFDPHGTGPSNADFERVRSWDEAARVLNLRSHFT